MSPKNRHAQLCTVMALDGGGKPRALAQLMLEVLQGVPATDRVVVSTKNGALIAFLGDPQDALAVTMALRKHLDSSPGAEFRAGISLGAVQFTSEASAPPSMGGEPVDTALRLAGSARPGQLLAAYPFFKMVSRLAATYGALFNSAGKDIYEIGGEAPVRASRAEAPAAQRPAEPAKIVDAGANLVISGSSRAAVEEALAGLARKGALVGSEITQVGAKWMATATNSAAPAESVRVEEAGFMRIITAPTREAVEEKVDTMTAVGARLISPIELHEGSWTAVCDFGGGA